MAKESVMNPSHIPVDPRIYALLSQAFCDENLKERMFQAVNNYNEKCEEAYLQLLNDLRKILELKSS
jgi:hypothetical protein